MARSPKLVSALVLLAGIAPFGRAAFAADTAAQPALPTAPVAAPAATPAGSTAALPVDPVDVPAPAPTVAPAAPAAPQPEAAPAPVPTPELEAAPEPESEATPEPEAEPAVESAAAEAPAPAVEEAPVLAPAAADTTLSGAAAEFLAATNASRASVGAAPLVPNASLTAYAVAHAQTMASAGQLYHSDISVLLGGWSTVGENVGVGPSVPAIHAALLASPGHYRNLADPGFTHVGIGVYVDGGGRTWTAHVFAA